MDMYSIACSLITKTHHVGGIIEMTFAKYQQARGLLFRVLVDYIQAFIEASGVRASYYNLGCNYSYR